MTPWLRLLNRTKRRIGRVIRWELVASHEDTALGRFTVTIALFFVLFLVVFGRNAYIAFSPAPTKPFAARTEAKNLYRGNILDRNQHMVATTVIGYNLAVDPRAITDMDWQVSQIVRVFPQIDPQALRQLFNSKQKFAYVARDITPQQMAIVKQLKLQGVIFEPMPHRVYPYGNLLSHVVGTMNIDHQAQSGVEFSLNNQLRNLDTINLSIDIRLQQIMHDALQDSMNKYRATGAGALILDIRNGEILSLVSLPDFDPYRPQLTDINLINRVTMAAYEMGSTFKILNTAMALHYNIANLDSQYRVDEPIRIAQYQINDFEKHSPIMSVADIFAFSSNIGSGRMADQMTSQQQIDFLHSVGILSPTTLELPELGRPIYPKNWNRIEKITISYGQGIAVTMLQMARATAAILNGGILITPTLLANKDTSGALIQRVISTETSQKMQGLMRLAVVQGTGSAANGSGYNLGGKTGTAQRPDDKKTGYSRTAVNASFVGVFPMDRPQYLVMVMLEDPKGLGLGRTENTAGKIVAPVVKKVVAQIAPMLGQVGMVHAENFPVQGHSAESLQTIAARNNAQ